MSESSPSTSKNNRSVTGGELESTATPPYRHNEQWFDNEYIDAQIDTDLDIAWLTSLANRTPAESEIDMLNSGIVAVGSVHINEGTDPLLVAEVVRAREKFYSDVLGWSDENHPMYGVYMSTASQRQLPPLSTVIRTQRYLSTLGDVDGALLIRRNPSLVSMSVGSIQPKVEHLVDIGIKDVPKLVTGNPNIFSMEVGSLDEKIRGLSNLGFNTPTILIEKNPAILNKTLSNVASKLQVFDDLGIKNPTGFIERLPTILGSSSDSIIEKFSILREAGVGDVAKLVEKRPEIMGLSRETIRTKLQNFTDIGFSKPGQLLDKFAATLTYSIESVNNKIESLRAMGFHSPVEVFEKAPPLLGFSPETIAAKMQSFSEMLIALGSPISPIELIENTPTLLGVADSKIVAIAAFISSHEFDSQIKESPKTISKLFFIPVDSYVGLLSTHEEGEITAAQLSLEVRSVKPTDRRVKSLDKLNDPSSRSSIGAVALKAYLTYSPLSEQEKARYSNIDE